MTMTIYANFHSPFLRMLHIKFGFDWPSSFREDVRIFWSYTCIFLKVFAIYSPGARLGQVTWTIYTNFRSPFLRMLHMKFEFDWPSGFRKEDDLKV